MTERDYVGMARFWMRRRRYNAKRFWLCRLLGHRWIGSAFVYRVCPRCRLTDNPQFFQNALKRAQHQERQPMVLYLTKVVAK